MGEKAGCAACAGAVRKAGMGGKRLSSQMPSMAPEMIMLAPSSTPNL